jgi:anti-anti-sigma factor
MSDFECIELDSVDDVSVVKFKDQKVMDPARIEALGEELLSLVDAKSPDKSETENQANILINFENVRFFSSGAINKLIVLEKRLRANGRQIRLSNLRPEVRDLFSYTNLDSMFDIRDGQAEAIESFEEK